MSRHCFFPNSEKFETNSMTTIGGYLNKSWYYVSSKYSTLNSLKVFPLDNSANVR